MCFISILLRSFLHITVHGSTVIAALLVLLFQISIVSTCILDASGWFTVFVNQWLVWCNLVHVHFRLELHFYEIHIKRSVSVCCFRFYRMQQQRNSCSTHM